MLLRGRRDGENPPSFARHTDHRASIRMMGPECSEGPRILSPVEDEPLSTKRRQSGIHRIARVHSSMYLGATHLRRGVHHALAPAGGDEEAKTE